MALIQMDFMAESIQRITSVNVLLPVDASSGVQAGPFPALYLLHGYEGNYMDWVSYTRIARLAPALGLAVVMPSGENAYYLDFPERAEYFETYIASELVAFTRNAFPLSTRREDTFLAGLSMGGGGALRIGLRHSGVFGKVAALSAGITVEQEAKELGHDADLAKTLQDALARRVPLPELFLSIGTEDPLLQVNRDYHALLQRCGVSHTYEEHPGGHTWDYWDGHLPDMLGWLLPQSGGAAAKEREV